MKGILFHRSIWRYATLKLVASRLRGLYGVRRLLPLTYGDLPEPPLPGARWVRIRPICAGICGSDLSTIFAKGSPYLAPVTSMPFVPGHEVVGRIVERGEEVRRFKEGDRVVIHPALGCRVRGIEPVCSACDRGRDALCRNVTRGVIAKGIQTGYCRDTGGGWSESLVAHESQVYKVPPQVDDLAAVLIEPFACCLHGALQGRPADDETVLVIGCGAIGLLTIAALRALGCRARIVAAARYDHQRALARTLGATELISARGGWRARYEMWAETLNAEILKPEIGKPTVIGGADVTYDCVASSESLDDAVRFTRAGGRLVLVGMPAMASGLDLTPLWYKELTVHAAYAYGPERIGDRTMDTFDLAIELTAEWSPKLTALLSRPYELADYMGALSSALNTSRSGAAKTIFRIDDG